MNHSRSGSHGNMSGMVGGASSVPYNPSNPYNPNNNSNNNGGSDYENYNNNGNLNTSYHSHTSIATSPNNNNNSSSNNHKSQQQSSTSSSSGSTGATVSKKKNKHHMPVMYRLSWSASSPAMTITLLVPKRVVAPGASTKSPFKKVGNVAADSKVDNNDDTNNNNLDKDSSKSKNKEVYSLRIPLNYLLQLANHNNSGNSNNYPDGEGNITDNNGKNSNRKYPGWLDRQTLRARLNGGGRAIGLEPPFLYRAMTAVEESALHLPEWVPVGTEHVHMDVVMGGGVEEGWVQCEATVIPSFYIHPASNSNNSLSYHPSNNNNSNINNNSSMGSGMLLSSSSLTSGASNYNNPNNHANNTPHHQPLYNNNSQQPSYINQQQQVAVQQSHHPHSSSFGHFQSSNNNHFAGFNGNTNVKTNNTNNMNSSGFGSIGGGGGTSLIGGGMPHHLHQQSMQSASNPYNNNSNNSSLAMFSQTSSIWPAASASTPGWPSSMNTNTLENISQNFMNHPNYPIHNQQPPQPYNNIPAATTSNANTADTMLRIGNNNTNNNTDTITRSVSDPTASSNVPVVNINNTNNRTTHHPSLSSNLLLTKKDNSNNTIIQSTTSGGSSSIHSGGNISIKDEVLLSNSINNQDSKNKKKPDPNSIMAPLLSMGFTEKQCIAAIRAIELLDNQPSEVDTTTDNAMNNVILSNTTNLGTDNDAIMNKRRTSTTQSRLSIANDNNKSNSSINSDNANKNNDKSDNGRTDTINDNYESKREAEKNNKNLFSSLGQSSSAAGVTRQISGEDIVDYILSSGDGLKSTTTAVGNGNGNDHKDKNSNSNITSNVIEDKDISTFGAAATANSTNDRSNVSSHIAWDTTKKENSNRVGASGSNNAVASSSNKQNNPTVWGNAGKLKVVKSLTSTSGSASGAGSGTKPATNLTPATTGTGTGAAAPTTQMAWSNAASVSSNASTTMPTSSTVQSQPSKMVKVLDVPQDLNAFVFHCNAQTREECLERKMFGCPSGGQYGPHSKAKANDLLFLADFSAWTVTGIFTAKSDAALNIEKEAWNGRFPWQIRVCEWQPGSSLRTIHIDRVNEILGLASGSKLNMLTKEQLTKLVCSKEFAPVVPSCLFKMKMAHPTALPNSSSSATTMAHLSTSVSSSNSTDATIAAGSSGNSSATSSTVSGANKSTIIGAIGTPEVLTKSMSISAASLSSNSNRMSKTTIVEAMSSSTLNQPSLNTDEGIKFHQQPQFHQFQSSNYHDEHPATAMHRVKLVSAWFDATANSILTLNELYQNPKKSMSASHSSSNSRKEKNLSDELSRFAHRSTYDAGASSWPLMTFNQVRNGLGVIFDQWLFQSHAIGNDEGRSARFIQLCKNGHVDPTSHISFDESGSWTRQGRSGSSGSRNKREDPVLLSHIPGSVDHIRMLLQETEGISSLAIPDDELAEVLANKFVRDLEQISVEVRKTQSALVRIGGEDFLKSVEDKMLGMRLSEVTTKYYDEEGDTVEKTIMRIEWHTKSSIAQGRPPQVQKIYKNHFDMLSKYYREYSSGTDPELKHMLTRTFVLLCRYDLIGEMKNGCNVSLPPLAFDTLTKHFGVTHECFTSPMNHVCPSYNSIFPDIDRYFGSLGSFFDFVPKEGSFELDIPFNGVSAKMILDHILGLLYQSDSDKNPLSFIIIVPQGNEFLEYAQNSPFLRRTVNVEVDTANVTLNFMSEMQYKDIGSSSRKVSRNTDDSASADEYAYNLILWLQNDFGHDLWTPVDEKVQAVVDCFENII